ncbi:transcriptional regulator family: Fungal Specific TF [Penicillium roqueforti]|nr:transcriptional regulator family: Fungal Specific TF [Penicillium roqueforti]
MKNHGRAVNPPDNKLGPGNSTQNELPDASSIENFPSTLVANTASTFVTEGVKGGDSANGKVAIPRQRSNTAPRYNRRAPRACESCRKRKTKCSGEIPVCQQCQGLEGTCLYPLKSVEKMKRQVINLSEKAQVYENVLKDLGSLVDTRIAARITGLLDKHDSDIRSSRSATLPDELIDEPSSPSSIGSLGDIDQVGEDLNRNEHSRATGYMGKTSEITWLQRLQRGAQHHSHQLLYPSEYGRSKRQDDDLALYAVNYHLDEEDISVPEPVDTYAVPPRQLADKLLDDYLRTVHPFFPIIHRPLFTAQYRTFFDGNANPSDKWLAILNMIFAISAQHAHLIRASWRGEERDHLIYLTRSRVLSMSGDDLFSHPDLQQVQVEGLVAFYLLSSDQINRAWRISALAVRSAVALGINMKNESPRLSDIAKETRYRVWWCLYTFEHLLGIMTGRATCILGDIYTTPLPLPLEDDELSGPVAAEVLSDTQLRDKRINNIMASASVRHIPLNPAKGANTTNLARVRDNVWVKSLPFSFSLCHLYYCDLTIIVQEVINRVYFVDSVMKTWAHILNNIRTLKVRIDMWYHSLPEIFKSSKKKDDAPDLLRCKLALYLHFYSARITLGRPCLCRRDTRRKSSANRSTFSSDIAELTLQSAKLMLDLISDEPNVIELYELSPWWCILHYLMQAATVILLKISFWDDKIPEEEANCVDYAKKSIRWLYAMSEHSIASQRAWQLCDISLRRLATGTGIAVDDMPSAPYFQPAPTFTLGSHHYSSRGFQPVSDSPWDSLSNDLSLNTSHLPMYDAYQACPNMATTDPTGLSSDSSHVSDHLYFPYDPISEEFIRSFFPQSSEDR